MAQPAEKKFFIAVNPKSGRYREKLVQKYLARFLCREGISAEIYCFVDEGGLSRKVQESHRPSRLLRASLMTADWRAVLFTRLRGEGFPMRCWTFLSGKRSAVFYASDVASESP